MHSQWRDRRGAICRLFPSSIVESLQPRRGWEGKTTEERQLFKSNAGLCGLYWRPNKGLLERVFCHLSCPLLCAVLQFNTTHHNSLCTINHYHVEDTGPVWETRRKILEWNSSTGCQSIAESMSFHSHVVLINTGMNVRKHFLLEITQPYFVEGSVFKPKNHKWFLDSTFLINKPPPQKREKPFFPLW